MDDPSPRRPSPDLALLLDAVKRRNKDKLHESAAPKAANRRALARALKSLLAPPSAQE